MINNSFPLKNLNFEFDKRNKYNNDNKIIEQTIIWMKIKVLVSKQRQIANTANNNNVTTIDINSFFDSSLKKLFNFKIDSYFNSIEDCTFLRNCKNITMQTRIPIKIVDMQ